MTKPRETYVVIRRNPPSISEPHHCVKRLSFRFLSKQAMPVGIYISMSREDDGEMGRWG